MPYFFLIFIILIQVILSLGHWFLYRTIIRFLDVTDPATIALLRWSLGILSLAYILASLVAFRYYNIFSRTFYTLATGWLGIFYFLLLSSIVIWAASLLPINHKLFAGILLTIGAFVAVYSLYNANQVKVTDLTVKLPNLPASWQGKTAVWVSDTHLGQVRGENFAKKIVAMIQAQHPDVVFIGGDLYDGTAVPADEVIRPFSQLKTPDEVYFITGNHEEFGNDATYISAIKNAGITDLDDKMIVLDGLQMIGVDYRDSSNPQKYKDILIELNINPKQPSILLKHEPNNLQIAEAAGVNFQFSGHTHNGQVPPFGFIFSSYFKGYGYGLKAFGKMEVYTSSGAGTWGPPIRFGTHSEIVRIRFERTDK